MPDTAVHAPPLSRTRTPASGRASARAVYFALLHEREAAPGSIDELARLTSRSFVADRLAEAARMPEEIPADPRAIAGWLDDARREVGHAYEAYLDQRHAGAPRRYFGTRSHALYFLRSVAPTKLVDGCWLYGLLPHWNDPRFAGLLRIYLEELGEGRIDRNHVVLYRKLLRQNGCEAWDGLADGCFMQGAIQLSLAHHASGLLPEIVGFNLGYEQLPLHLLITAHELRELDIDPYYFTLHVTVDNASTGHARRSLDAIMDAMPRLGDTGEFCRRIAAGYRLNALGQSAVDVVHSFDLEHELTEMLKAKSELGSQMHSDHCRIGGRTVNHWLAEPDRMPDFLETLADKGWLRQGQDPRDSRFWQLIQGEAAPMFGVFSPYEQQLLLDWLAGNANDAVRAPATGRTGMRRLRCAASADNPLLRAADDADRRRTINRALSIPTLVETHFTRSDLTGRDDFNAELHLLKERLAAAPDTESLMAMLIGLMSPANHHTPTGLIATRIFTDMFDRT